MYKEITKATGELWEHTAREGKRVQSQGRDLSYEGGVRSQEFLGRARMLRVAQGIQLSTCELRISRIRGRLTATRYPDDWNERRREEGGGGEGKAQHRLWCFSMGGKCTDGWGPRCDCGRWETREIRFNVLIVLHLRLPSLPPRSFVGVRKGFYRRFSARRTYASRIISLAPDSQLNQIEIMTVNSFIKARE